MVSHILEPSIADPLFPFWPVWWNSATLPLNNHAQYPQTSWWLVGILSKTGYSCLWGIDITLWLALLNVINLAFLETFINFTFVQIINSWYLLYGNDETLTQNLLIPRQKPNCFDYTGVQRRNGCFPLGIKGFWVWDSSLRWFTYKRHVAQIIKYSQLPSVNISITEHLVLHSLCEALLNLMPSSDRRNYFKVNDKETKRKKENYELSNCSKWYILISNLSISLFLCQLVLSQSILSLYLCKFLCPSVCLS